MRNTIKPIVVRFLSFLCLLPVIAADLKTCKDVYQKNADEIRQTFQPKFADLQQQYQRTLDSLKALAVKQGDLIKAKAAIAESERFNKAKSLPAETDESAIPEIKNCQYTYVQQYAKLETDLTVKLGTLTTKYEQALERLQKELTQAEKLNEATAVQEEREKAQAALKGFADQMSALTGSPATNGASGQASKSPAIVSAGKATVLESASASRTKAQAAKTTLGENVVFNGDFSQCVRKKPDGWGGKAALLTVEKEEQNSFVRFEENLVKKDGTVSSLHCTSQEITIPKGAASVIVSAKIRTKDCVSLSTIPPGVQVELVNQEGKTFRYIAASWCGKNGSWETVQTKANIPKEAAKANVVISTGYRPGQIDFDDVEVIFE